jgi:hypothetical protein
VYLQYRSSAKDLTCRRAIVAVAGLVSPRKHGLAMGLSKEEYHRMSRPKSNKVEKKSKQQQSLANNVQSKPGIQSQRSFLLLQIPFVRRQMPRSPSQLRRKCRVICKKPGCQRQSSVAGCNAARGLGEVVVARGRRVGVVTRISGGERRARLRGAVVDGGMQEA